MASISEQVNLMDGIEKTRRTMIELGMKYGFTSEQTVAASQLLDKLMNEYFLVQSRI